MHRFKKPLTEGRIARIKKLHRMLQDRCIASLHDGEIFAHSDRWTGTNHNAAVGSGFVFNNPHTSTQLTMLLAISEHPVVEGIGQISSFRDSERYAVKVYTGPNSGWPIVSPQKQAGLLKK